MGWDQPLNPEQVKEITAILHEFRRVDEFVFPRQVVYEAVELRVFVDASSKAYGAVAYLVNKTNPSSNLLVSKSRVALCKQNRLTIPKLELTAASVGCRLINHLNTQFSLIRIFLLSGSKVTLSWISSEKEQKDVYVANRVSEIQQHVIALGINCMYVPAADNPADLVSRGSTVNKLKQRS